MLASTAVALLACGLSTTASADGASLYSAKCASCHGADGAADTPAAKAMKVPALKGGDATAEAVAKHVRESPKHKSISGSLSDEDLKTIAEHVAAL